MTSNDERREVAARLREIDFDWVSESSARLLSKIEQALGLWAEKSTNCEGVANRLADLIEPEGRTCRFIPENIHWYFDENDNEIETEEGHPDGSMECSCSKCGYPMLSDEGGWFDEEEGPHGGIVYKPRFNFCPNCGSRASK